MRSVWFFLSLGMPVSYEIHSGARAYLLIDSLLGRRGPWFYLLTPRGRGGGVRERNTYAEVLFGPPRHPPSLPPSPESTSPDSTAPASIAATASTSSGAPTSTSEQPPLPRRRLYSSVLFILDNSKGPSDKDFNFALGIFWKIHDLDAAAAVSPAGKCSHDVPVEKVNGGMARRIRGSMVTFQAESDDPMARANESLRTLCDRVHGATCNGGGGCIDVIVAADVETSFTWDAVEQKTFLGLSALDREAFTSTHEGTWPGISDLYRTVHEYQFGTNSDGHMLFFHDSGSCMWRKRDGCGAHGPWRGPAVQQKMLDAWSPSLAAIGFR
jgi:hypothetical protein